MIEIERKFLVKSDSWRKHSTRSKHIVQGYLANSERGSIRIRVSGDTANLNIKSMTLGVSRSEYEYPIPMNEAQSMLKDLCIQPLIEKTRHYIDQSQHIWEVDVFEGENAGLVVAEIELAYADEVFHKPDWVAEEVSDDHRYYNVCLVEYPYSQW